MWAYGEENVAILAVALLGALVQNHPFEQGNKRVALIAARAFLINNGFDIGLSDDELGPLIVDLAAGHLAEEDVADVVEEHLVALYA